MTTTVSGPGEILTLERSDPRLTATVEIVIPVYNEEADLGASIRRLHAYLTERFPLPWLVTIADNASTDRTWGIACRLAGELGGVRAIHLDEKGRGRALRAAWSASAAPVVAYMDVDLSTDLDALLPLVAPLVSGHSDVAIGSRLAPGSHVVRGSKREVISRAYNLIVRAALHSGFSDAQCGFKAVRTPVARALLPLVQDQGWFFDTELLVVAERNGLRIHEVPVDWVDDPDSRVDIVSTAVGDLKGIWRMVRRFGRGEGVVRGGGLGRRWPRNVHPTDELARFGPTAIAGAALFAVAFGVLAPFVGAVVAVLAAAVVGSLVGARADAAPVRPPGGNGSTAWRAVLRRAALAGLPVAAALAVLAGLRLAGVGASAVAVEAAALTGAYLAAVLGRRVWMGRAS